MKKIALGELVRGAVEQIPAAPRAAKGLASMLVNRPGRHQSIGRLIEQIAARSPNQIAAKVHGASLTYAALNQQANKVAHTLSAAQIGAGDVVLIGTGNTLETLVCVVGTVKLGAIAALLPSGQSGESLAHSVELTHAKAAVCDADMAQKLDDCGVQADSLSARWLIDGAARDEWMLMQDAVREDTVGNPASTRDVQLQQPCFYIFTSGTTGMPKASVMTHYRFFASLRGMGDAVVRLPRGGTIYCPLPLYHNNGLTVAWGVALAAEGAIAIAPKFSASQFWNDVRRFDAQAFCYIGELCRYLLAQPTRADDTNHGVEVMVGNGLRPELWTAFKTRFGIARVAEFYGASESNVAFVNAFNQNQTAGYCPMPHAVVAFDPDKATPQRNAHGTLTKVPRSEPGLLITKVHAMARYDGYTNEDASESKLIHNAFKPGDCWFNTGDLVRQQGFGHIQFVDRLGDTFRWKGENVSTTEVERALTNFPAIQEAVVYGVEVPGADGRAGMAALVTKDDQCDLDVDALLAHLQTRLASYAIPQFLLLADHAATTSTFKHDKTTLKREAYDTDVVRDPLYQLRNGAYCRLKNTNQREGSS